MSAVRLLSFLALVLLVSGCGGSDDEPVVPTAPGTLRLLAAQGQAAPGTAGNFALLPLQPVMDNHASGWSAFVAPTTDAAKPQVLYAAAPDGTVIEVFAVNDPALGSSDGTIADFRGVWVRNGFLVVIVDIAGDSGGRVFGILSASLATGGASDKLGVLHHMDSLAAAGLAETLAGVDDFTPRLESDGTFWFLALGSSGDESLLSIEKNGTGIEARAVVGGALEFGASIVTVDAFSVDPTGTFFAIVADTNAAERRIYLQDTAAGTFEEVMQEGDAFPGSVATATNIHKGGRLVVYDVGVVIWMAASGAFDVLMAGDSSGPAGRAVMSTTGEAAPLSDSGIFAGLLKLNVSDGCTIPQFGAQVGGSSNGVTFGTYGHTNVLADPVLATDNLSHTTAGFMSATYVGLASAIRPYTEVSRDGSFLFGNQLAAGTSAILWLIPGERIYALAVEGEASPTGAAFAGLGGTSAHVVADGSALFRVTLAGGLSALLRRGP